MADTIPDHFQTEFSANWLTRIQQTQSKLGPFTPQVPLIVGDRKRFSRIGKTTSRQTSVRKADTIWDDGDDDFRWAVYQNPFVLTKLLDQYDEANLGSLTLPNTEYINLHAATYQRDMDKTIAKVLLDPAVDGKAGTTTVALPAGQIIAASAAGLTIAKLLKAREVLSKASVPMENRYMIVAPEDITSLLNTTQVTSADYNTVRALSLGQVDTFCGFKFIEVPDALPVAAGVRSCIAVHMAPGSEMSAVKMIYHQKGSTIDRIAVKSNAVGIQTHYRIGGVRCHDEAVVRVDVTA